MRTTAVVGMITMMSSSMLLTVMPIGSGSFALDPTRGIKRYADGEFHTWTDDEIDQFEGRWPIGSKERLMFDVFLYFVT